MDNKKDNLNSSMEKEPESESKFIDKQINNNSMIEPMDSLEIKEEKEEKEEELPIIPVIGELEPSSKKTKKLRKCKKGTHRYKNTHRCRKNKTR